MPSKYRLNRSTTGADAGLPAAAWASATAPDWVGVVGGGAGGVLVSIGEAVDVCGPGVEADGAAVVVSVGDGWALGDPPRSDDTTANAPPPAARMTSAATTISATRRPLPDPPPPEASPGCWYAGGYWPPGGYPPGCCWLGSGCGYPPPGEYWPPC